MHILLNLAKSTRFLISHNIGFSPRKIFSIFFSFPRYLRDLLELQRQIKRSSRRQFSISTLHPCLTDFNQDAGATQTPYFYQDYIAALWIKDLRPNLHLDFGSRIDGFITSLLSSRIAVHLIDVRPSPLQLDGLDFIQSDLLDLSSNDYLPLKYDSISALHSIEHVGLGRYGDRLSLDGDLLGIKCLINKLNYGGYFYLSVPVSKQNNIEFNSQRAYNFPMLLSELQFLNLTLVRVCHIANDFRSVVYSSDDEICAISVSNIEGWAVMMFQMNHP